MSLCTCQTAREANAPPPVFLCRPRVGPLPFLAPQCEGSGAPSGATAAGPFGYGCRPLRVTAAPFGERALRLPVLHCGVLLPAPGRAFRLGIPAQVISLLQAGVHSDPGRSPGAARVRVCETRPRAPHRPE